MKPPTDDELVKTAEAWGARQGQEEEAKLLRFLRERRRVSEVYPLTDKEAMELANSELHTMRADIRVRDVFEPWLAGRRQAPASLAHRP